MSLFASRLFRGSVLMMGVLTGLTSVAIADPYTFTTLEYPGATVTVTVPGGVNNAGQIVGYYETSTPGTAHGFLYQGGTFTTIDFPGSSYQGAAGINSAGVIIGSYSSNGTDSHGYVYSGGTFTALDVPSATGFTVPVGINDAGLVSGYYNVGTGTHGFLDNGGVFTTIDVPGATPGISI